MRKTLLLFAILLVSIIVVAPLAAQTARLVHYQGTLADADGNKFTGAADLQITLYNSPRSDKPLWSETHTAVDVRDGEYSVLLGSVTPLKLSFYEYFLEVKTDTVETTPGRKMIVGSGYNYRLWFLFAAYTIVWLAIFLYVVSISRRQKKVISDLELLAEATQEK